MEMILKKTIGKNTYTFVVEGKNLYELVNESQKLSFGDVLKCGICDSNNLILQARKASKKYEYVEVQCLNKNCKAQLVFGRTQEDPNVFYARRNEQKEFDWQQYSAKEESQSN